jgi:hypothetical protein
MKLEQVKLQNSRMQSNNRQNIKGSQEDADSNRHKENHECDSVPQVHNAGYHQPWLTGTPLTGFHPRSGDYWVGFFGVDAEVFYGFGYDTGLDFAVLLQFVQGG